MGTEYLIDTNAIIEFLGGSLPNSASDWLQDIIEKNLHHLSVINHIELLSYQGPDSEVQVLQDFINASDVLALSDAVVQKTIDLRRNLKIKLPDAIIAATALVNQLTLISRNTVDFRSVPGLTTIDPYTR